MLDVFGKFWIQTNAYGFSRLDWSSHLISTTVSDQVSISMLSNHTLTNLFDVCSRHLWRNQGRLNWISIWDSLLLNPIWNICNLTVPIWTFIRFDWQILSKFNLLELFGVDRADIWVIWVDTYYSSICGCLTSNCIIWLGIEVLVGWSIVWTSGLLTYTAFNLFSFLLL